MIFCYKKNFIIKIVIIMQIFVYMFTQFVYNKKSHLLNGGLIVKEKRGQWNSRLGFILAAAGSAVGLGNIWKFPGKVGANGGGAFLLTYMIVVAIIGFTVMMAEFAIGERHIKML